MSLTYSSPLVYQCSWGEIEVEGFGKFKDVLLLPGSAEAWVWESPYDSHATALSLPLLERLHGESEVVVLSLGMESKLKVSEEVLFLTATWGPNVFIADTHAAVKRYNDLVQEGRRVSLALHSTC